MTFHLNFFKILIFQFQFFLLKFLKFMKLLKQYFKLFETLVIENTLNE